MDIQPDKIPITMPTRPGDIPHTAPLRQLLVGLHVHQGRLADARLGISDPGPGRPVGPARRRAAGRCRARRRAHAARRGGRPVRAYRWSGRPRHRIALASSRSDTSIAGCGRRVRIVRCPGSSGRRAAPAHPPPLGHRHAGGPRGLAGHRLAKVEERRGVRIHVEQIGAMEAER